MIVYLLRKYAGIMLVVAVLLMARPLLFGRTLSEAAPMAFFWSGLAAAPLTYWELRRHQLWPLYDNLRLPRLALLALLVGATEVLVLLALLLFG